MDPIGISLGIPGVITLLISTALEGYQIFVTARALGDDFKELQRPFGVQRERFKDWAYATNRHANDGLNSEKRIADFLEQHPEKLELIANTLAQVAKVFADIQQMKSTYGISIIEPATSIKSASHENRTSHFRRMKEKARNLFYRPKEIPDPVIPPTNIIQDLHIALPLNEVKKLAQGFKCSVSSYGRLKWALCDKDNLRALIAGLERYNQDLEHLMVRYFASTVQILSSKLPENASSSEFHFMVPFPKNEDYVGKSQVRTFVEEKRSTQGTLIISHVSVALCGLGGAGVFWIHCESPARFDADYRRLAKLVKIPGYNESDSSQNARGTDKNWLESKESGTWILVFDNPDNKTDFFPGSDGGESAGLAKYIPKCAKGTIVIKTRDSGVANQLAGPRGLLTKKAMVPTDASTLFQQQYPGGAPYNDADCAKLLQELQYLPLAISQVASYLQMNEQAISTTQYLAKFQQKKKQSPLANSILRLIACIDPQGIPYELLATLESGGNEILLGEALATLQNFSLLQIQTDATGKSYTVHSLVHLLIQHSLTDEEKATAFEATAKALATVIPPDADFKNWPQRRRYLTHTMAFLSNAGKRLHICKIEGTDLQKKVLETRKVLFGEDRPDTLDAMYDLANTLQDQGRLGEAKKILKKALETLKVLIGEDHPDTLTDMHNLAYTYYDRSSMDIAIEMMEEVISHRLRISGSEHEYTKLSIKTLEMWKAEETSDDEPELESPSDKASVTDSNTEILAQ
ncbi:prion-inhibition and propagation-domain-containing protein [Pyronema domesticum]|nr:prion-inhibition and propagation-domain-containing protein [Pyronema domesticum]